MKNILNYSNSELVELKERKSYREIAFLFRISESRVYQEYANRGILYKKIDRLKDVNNEELIQLRKQNMTYSEIGDKYGVSANTISKEFKDRDINIEISKRCLSDYSDEEFKSLRKIYKPSSILADYLGVSVSTLYKEIHKRKIRGTKIDSDDVRELRLKGYSYEKIAEILDVSVNTVYRHK